MSEWTEEQVARFKERLQKAQAALYQNAPAGSPQPRPSGEKKKPP